MTRPSRWFSRTMIHVALVTTGFAAMIGAGFAQQPGQAPAPPAGRGNFACIFTGKIKVGDSTDMTIVAHPLRGGRADELASAFGRAVPARRGRAGTAAGTGQRNREISLLGQPVFTKPNVLHWHGAAPEQARRSVQCLQRHAGVEGRGHRRRVSRQEKVIGSVPRQGRFMSAPFVAASVMALALVTRAASIGAQQRSIGSAGARAGDRTSCRGAAAVAPGHVQDLLDGLRAPVALADLLRRLHRPPAQPAQADHAGQRRAPRGAVDVPGRRHGARPRLRERRR